MISGVRIVVALLMVAALLVGCSGEIRMRKLTDQVVTDTEHPIHGVLVYQPAFFIEQSMKTTLVVNGMPAGRANDTPAACTPVPSERIIALPDLRNPYALSYHPGLFDKNTMGVVLNSSMVQAVNATPAPAPSPSGSSGSSFTSALAALPPIPDAVRRHLRSHGGRQPVDPGSAHHDDPANPAGPPQPCSPSRLHRWPDDRGLSAPRAALSIPG